MKLIEGSVVEIFLKEGIGYTENDTKSTYIGKNVIYGKILEIELNGIWIEKFYLDNHEWKESGNLCFIPEDNISHIDIITFPDDTLGEFMVTLNKYWNFAYLKLSSFTRKL